MRAGELGVEVHGGRGESASGEPELAEVVGELEPLGAEPAPVCGVAAVVALAVVAACVVAAGVLELVLGAAGGGDVDEPAASVSEASPLHELEGAVGVRSGVSLAPCASVRQTAWRKHVFSCATP